MKSQNDLIISIVSVVLMLIIAGVCFGTKRVPVAPAPPATVVVSKPTLPTGEYVKMSNALPGASQNTPGGFGAGPAAGPAAGGGGGRPQAAGLQKS